MIAVTIAPFPSPPSNEAVNARGIVLVNVISICFLLVAAVSREVSVSQQHAAELVAGRDVRVGGCAAPRIVNKSPD